MTLVGLFIVLPRGNMVGAHQGWAGTYMDPYTPLLLAEQHWATPSDLRGYRGRLWAHSRDGWVLVQERH